MMPLKTEMSQFAARISGCVWLVDGLEIEDLFKSAGTFVAIVHHPQQGVQLIGIIYRLILYDA